MNLAKKYIYPIITVILSAVFSCSQNTEKTVTPWGSVIGDSIEYKNEYTLNDILNNGEIIVLTLSGPETYYDYRGYSMGTQYLLCEKFARQIGVSIRVDLCKDTAEMVSKLIKGDADLILFQLPKNVKDANMLIFCGTGKDSANGGWAVKADNKELADTLNKWYKPELLAEVRREETYLFSSKSIRRHVYSPMLSRAKGVISHYDGYFKQYSAMAGIDWRLMAAQCYQESCFDPNAQSWAGACGLMQIMPGTASHIGLPKSMIFNPEANIAAAARYMAELGMKFRDIADAEQRMYFTLACYNGGYNHIRDAMALARKHGNNPHRWEDVSHYVLGLGTAEYYNDPIVKYGYMRGSETVDYVAKIRHRYDRYCGIVRGNGNFGIGSSNRIPHKAKKKNRYRIDR